MPSPFPAHYDGICHKCGVAFKKGQYILWNQQSGASKQYHHVDCSNHEWIPTPKAPKDGKATSNPAVNEALQDLLDALQPKVDLESMREEILAITREEVEKLLVPETIVVKIGNIEHKVENIKPHRSFADLLYFLTLRVHVFLYGEPGWGKSSAIRDAAKSLNLPYRYTTLTWQTSDTRLIGFFDGNGIYHETPLRYLFANGGVFTIEEAPKGNGNTLSAGNNILANGIGEFPDGQVTQHKDFVCCATGNNPGIPNPNFPDDRRLDQAFKDRFFFYEWGEDKAFERTVALSINSKAGFWVDWIQAVRAFVKSNPNLQMYVSPRATYGGALHLAHGYLSPELIANGLIFKGSVSKETYDRVIAAHPIPKGQS